MPEALVYHFTLQLLSIVSDMHECGILHADIKPDNILLQLSSAPFIYSPDDWTVEDVLAQDKRTLKIIDFGRSIDLALYSDRTAFMHVFQDDKCPEMRDGKPWSYQVNLIRPAIFVFLLTKFLDF
jgi:checkpoint serine/threonine-protein kinase